MNVGAQDGSSFYKCLYSQVGDFVVRSNDLSCDGVFDWQDHQDGEECVVKKQELVLESGYLSYIGPAAWRVSSQAISTQKATMTHCPTAREQSP